MRGRMMSVYAVISMGGSPVGGPVIGWISQHAGARWGLVVGAVTAVVSAVAVALWLTRRSPSRLALAAPTRRTGELAQDPPRSRGVF